MTALRFCTIFNDFWTHTGPYTPWLKDEHVQVSEMGFRRFGARRESCVFQKSPIHVGSTGPVFAPYWSARLAVGCSKTRTASARARTASEGAPSETRGIHVRVHAILGQKSQEHTENQENACDNYIRRRVISYGLPTDNRLIWLHPSLTSRGTPVGLMHAT